MNPDTRAGVGTHSRHPHSSSSIVLFAPVDHVREVYRRYASHDWAGVLTLLAPGFELTQTGDLPWGGRFAGREGARRFYLIMNRHTEAEFEPHTFIPAGDEIAVAGRFRGRARASGRLFDLELVQIWTVKRGRVTRCASFTETSALRRVLAPGGNTLSCDCGEVRLDGV